MSRSEGQNMEYDLETIDVPTLETLSEAGVEAIHETTIEILEDIGIRISHEGAVELLEEHGASVEDDSEDAELVTIPRSLIEDAVAEAPSSFTLHARNPDRSVGVGDGDGPALASGYGAPNVRTFEDGTRSSTIDDYETLAKLAQSEDVIDVTGYNLCEPNDVPQEVKHYEMIQRSLTLTDKPILGSTYGPDRAKASLEMAGIANDDRELSKPYAAGVINTISPRRWDKKMTGGLIEYAKHGQPTLVSAAVMANASGPSPLAGSMALANAEILTGITIAQLTNPGTPVVYGLPSSNVDVRHGTFSIGSPEGALFVSYAAQIGRYYDIPSRAGGCLTDAKTVDDQSGAESMMQLMTTMYSGIDFVLHAAGILDSYSTVSPEKYVLDAERIRYVKRFQEGYDLDEDAFALDLLREVEPGGHFLDKRHTLNHCKTDHYMSEIYDRQSTDDWENQGEKTSFELAREKVDARLEEYEQPPLDEDLAAELERYVEKGSEKALQ
ncbi:trimethylamine methyltransferase family protein [Halalkaliarchaeum sp. AArc-GB]|uniref:trimethylamine methyltransferase family protein n=1 Tax=unclassified Halalkaliarchaeum TaxID=2678344 RepID=UPI00217D7713|nr:MULTISPECIES: trimethylamine methyltransferase family protein [unclassified Halalkaliarchaeum]MDR5672203.1 trimethylamine methyltransferase family protein [Halalkaliarchaeum sp. AArc-GB]